MKQKIEEIRKELEETEVHATRACELAVKLSAYWANINEQLVEREMTYNKTFVEFTLHEPTVAKAKVLAQASEDYHKLLEYQTLSKSCQEMIRSLNRLVRRKELEASTSRYG